jgi:Flp pilus assembly protein TadG
MRSERGTVTIWVLGLCVMMLLLGGLSLDLWRAYSERRALASAADAAAVAGAAAIDLDAFRANNDVRLRPDQAEARARASLTNQLDRQALSRARVHATHRQVVVDAQGTVDFTLLNLLDPRGQFDIEVSATAEPHASG